AHPTWNMGAKITIDSASLMNKGFEMIEACHLFQVKPSQVDVVVHPQSTVHSMVEYCDGSVLAQLGHTNMYLPILNALAYPERFDNKFPSLNLAEMGRLEFAQPDREKFPCLNYAYEAAEKGGSMPAAMNAANEIAVASFLAGQISFPRIAEIIRTVMDEHTLLTHPD
ncbi:TPA: 1-deoxy-D-xylulose-5-phosphate reductoisomerase, partial [Candidatus Sumerlaeota bacterium]|nr:1-deoxy-D-xylulose-5-phosphate reductoisomerase [Candidatus Sumerlaeota bacterium]